MITCYDYTSSKLISQTDIPIILIGDSIGNIIFGYDNTINVTIDDIIKSTQSVIRGNKKSLIISDMPFFSYKVSEEDTMKNVKKIIQEGGSQGIKIEGVRKF